MQAGINQLNNLIPYIPYLGVTIGAGLGSLSNFYKNNSIHYKDCKEIIRYGKTFFSSGPVCRSGPYGDSFLTTINHAKQKELSCFALATPFLPLVIPTADLLARSIKKRDKDQAFYLTLPQTIGKELSQIPISRIAHQGTLIAGSLLTNSILTYISHNPASPLYAFHSNGSNFDVSGHIILKMALTSCLINSLGSAENSAAITHMVAGKVFSTIIAASDVVMMFNTAENCHTVAEIAAGFFVAGAIHLTAAGIERTVTWLQANPSEEND